MRSEPGGRFVSVNVCLPLFGNPGHELEEGGRVQGQHLRTLGDELRERLQKAADVLDRLEAAGWAAHVAMYEVILTRAGVETRADAERELRALEIDPADLMIVEEVEEE
jgi:hypothetical protein